MSAPPTSGKSVKAGSELNVTPKCGGLASTLGNSAIAVIQTMAPMEADAPYGAAGRG